MKKDKFNKAIAFVLSLVVMLSMMPSRTLATEEEINITTEEELINILKYSNESETQGKIYSLSKDMVIDTNLLRDGLTETDNRVFAGSLKGNGHTITVENGNGSAPLFEQLRGSVSDLNVVFNGDVIGTPFAYDISYKNKDEAVLLNNLSVTVNGNVLYGNHDYKKYYGKNLTGSGAYGNWYIHFGGQPAHLATGFAWYLWGVSVSNVRVDIKGQVGESNRVEEDATSAGFAYFALKGGSTKPVNYNNIDVKIKDDILSNTGDGHASAYGFATGTADNSTMGGRNLDEVSNVSVKAKNITAYSQQGSSSAIGFARLMQGYTHDCKVDIEGKISAINVEGDAQEEKQGYSNGDAYAYGFMLNTSGQIQDRRNFVNNEVKVYGIYAKTSSETYAGSGFASGFAHQMMNTSSTVPNLTYNNNKVNVTNGDIKAEANKAGAVASGFVTHTGNDTSNRPDHIYENSVYVNGSIISISQQADATATGYSYLNRTHRRNCSVVVEKDIVAQSPSQAVAAGFNGLSNVGNNYFINDSSVTVKGDIKAIQTGDEQGICVAAGLNAIILKPSSGSSGNITAFNANRIEVDGSVLAQNNTNSKGYTGLLLAYNGHLDSSKGMIEIKDNVFVGKESIVQVDKNEDYPGVYTNFTGLSNRSIYAATTGNKVTFIREGQCPYTADVSLYKDSNESMYGDLWEMTNQTTVHDAQKITRKEATCVEDGNIEHWYCNVCGKYFMDEALTDEITKEDTVIKAIGHKFDSALHYDGQKHWRECVVCGYKEAKEDHSFKWIIDKEATVNEKGYKHEECEICGYKKDMVEIPKLNGLDDSDTTGANKNTNTGDNNNMLLWILALVATGASIFTLMVISKKSQHK